MKIIADESVDFEIVEALKAAGVEVIAVVEMDPGISDEEVLEMAFHSQLLLLTEDKDFGDLVVRLRKPNFGVLLLRLSGVDLTVKVELSIKTIIENLEKLYHHFSVLDERRLRIRRVYQ
jgi:predicted nuclease of predicted toxin-antitoxin system